MESAAMCYGVEGTPLLFFSPLCVFVRAFLSADVDGTSSSLGIAAGGRTEPERRTGMVKPKHICFVCVCMGNRRTEYVCKIVRVRGEDEGILMNSGVDRRRTVVGLPCARVKFCVRRRREVVGWEGCVEMEF